MGCSSHEHEHEDEAVDANSLAAAKETALYHLDRLGVADAYKDLIDKAKTVEGVKARYFEILHALP
nr:protein G albumin binding domain [synthetic construct]